MNFYDNFNSGSFDPTLWVREGNGRQAIINGKYIASWVPGDTPNRCEISANNKFNAETNYWVRWDMEVTRADMPFPPWQTVVQIHAIPHINPVTGRPDWNTVAGKNPFTVTLNNGLLGVAVNTTPINSGVHTGGAIANMLWESPAYLHGPSRWVLHYIPSFGSSGVVEVWKNGIMVVQFYGQNMDQVDCAGLPSSAQSYLKFGIYADPSNITNKSVAFDSIEVVESITNPGWL